MCVFEACQWNRTVTCVRRQKHVLSHTHTHNAPHKHDEIMIAKSTECRSIGDLSLYFFFLSALMIAVGNNCPSCERTSCLINVSKYHSVASFAMRNCLLDQQERARTQQAWLPVRRKNALLIFGLAFEATRSSKHLIKKRLFIDAVLLFTWHFASYFLAFACLRCQTNRSRVRYYKLMLFSFCVRFCFLLLIDAFRLGAEKHTQIPCFCLFSYFDDRVRRKFGVKTNNNKKPKNHGGEKRDFLAAFHRSTDILHSLARRRT